MYYSESEEEEEIVNEGKATICLQKIKLGISADNKSIDNDHFPDDVEGICNAWTSAVPDISLPFYNADKISGKCRKSVVGGHNLSKLSSDWS